MGYKTFGCGGSCGTCDCSHEDELLLDADDLELDEEDKKKKKEEGEEDEDSLGTDDLDEAPLDELPSEDTEDLDWNEEKNRQRDDRV